jgi:hypothetical protein
MILIPSTGPEDWRRLLADPEKHWRMGFSARTLAQCWEAAGAKFPQEIAALLPDGTEPLIIAPEWKTPLPGGRRESQSDILVLARTASGTMALTIEGKVDESFDRLTSEWLGDGTPGKAERLAFLCATLGLSQDAALHLRYQLLHRTAAAVIEARRFCAQSAGMIVHSFSPGLRWLEDFSVFAGALGAAATAGESAVVTLPGGMPLTLGWAKGEARFLRL